METIKNVSIKAISYYLPNNPIDVRVFSEKNQDWNLDKIIQKTGIRQVFHASENETAVDLAIKASENLFSTTDILKDSIDGLLFVTQSPDYILPTSACIIQEKLNLPNNLLAFDINLGCSGFVKSLSVASSLLNTGVCNNILIICSETYSKYIDQNDRTCLPLFSDGSSAVVVASGGDFEIGPFLFGVDGKGAENLIVHSGGARLNDGSAKKLYMNGAQVFIFTLEKVPQAISDFLNKNNLSIDNIDYFIFHQASNLILDAIAEKCKIPENKIIKSLEFIGNTVSSTIPITLKISSENKTIKKDSLILLVGFGVGYSWAISLVKWGSS